MRFRFPIAVLMVLFLEAVLASAAEKPNTVRETAEAILVEVPVRVTDRNGVPIKNLEAKDFELFDNGKKQEILGIDAIDLARKNREANTPDEINPAARRHFLVLFDCSFAHPKAILNAQRAAREFVLNGVNDGDFVAVATYTVEHGLKLLVTFSSDRVQVSRAIDTLGLLPAEDLGKDPLQFAFDIAKVSAQATGLGGREQQAAAIVETLQTLMALSKARADQYARLRVRRLTESLGEMARILDTVSGRKDVIYLSEGFESRLVTGTKDTEQEREWIFSGEQWKVDAEKRFGNTTLQGDLRQMADLFRRSDCVLHAVDIAGLRMDPETTSVQSRPSENSLFELAEPTGGDVLRNANDFKEQFGRLLTSTSLVYVLAFRPERTGEEGKFHELKVKVHASGAHVSARAGYYERRSFRALSPMERSLTAADVLANETPMTDLPVQISAAALPQSHGDAWVPVWIEVGGESLLSNQKNEKLGAEVYVYAYDAEKHLRDFIAQRFDLDIANVAEKLMHGGLKYCGQLALPPGSYRLRALVRNSDTGKMGLAVSNLDVPGFGPEHAYLLAPIFLEESDRAVLIRGRARAHSDRPEFPEYPLVQSPTETLVPAPLPEIQSGKASVVSVVAYHFGSPGSNSLKFGGSVLAEDGRPVAQATLTLRGQVAGENRDKQTLLLDFTPSALTPGRYLLRVFLHDGETGASAHAAAPFRVP
ncbi:MAG TPA: VWA domain-containing protein [Thermoanaerobaculia bacterium]